MLEKLVSQQQYVTVALILPVGQKDSAWVVPAAHGSGMHVWDLCCVSPIPHTPPPPSLSFPSLCTLVCPIKAKMRTEHSLDYSQSGLLSFLGLIWLS